MFLALAGSEAGSEPLGQRIIETPVNADETEILRNPRSGFVTYVPPGSLKKGQTLVENGVTASGAKVTPCTACHGLDLRGLGPVPRLAGRSPSYIARQLYDIQRGNRAGIWTPLMAAVVANLGPDDLLTASAYLASLEPEDTRRSHFGQTMNPMRWLASGCFPAFARVLNLWSRL
jgi:cytochrome c553